MIPESAHGTNPASVILAGYEPIELATNKRGRVDIDDLKNKINNEEAGMMLTQPNTIGLFEDEILIRSSNFSYYGLSPYLDLPIYLEYGGYCENVSGDDSPAIDILLASLDEESCYGINITQWNKDISYTIQGLHFIKPQKYNLGFKLTPKSHKNMLLTFEFTNREMQYNYTKWNCDNAVDYVDGNLSSNDYEGAEQQLIKQKDDLFEIRMGFEHYLKNSFPIRVGLVYSEAIFNSLEPTTIFTLGSGKKINNLNIDFAMNYSMNTYRYYDIFPIDNIYNQSCENDVYCNQVKETQLSFLTTIKLGF